MDVSNITKFNTQVPHPTRRSLGLEIVLLVVVIALAYFFLLRPKLNDLSQQKQSLAALNAQDQTLQADIDDLNALVGKMKSDSADIAKLDEALPLNGKTTTVQILLNNLAAQSGMTVGDLSVAPTGNDVVAGDKTLLNDPYGKSRKVKAIAATLSLEGSVDQLQAFLKKLETSARVIDVTSLEVAQATKGNLDFKLVLSTYAYE